MDLFPRSISDAHKNGFTITEVIVSALIIVILSTGLFSAFWGTQHLLNRARHKAQAYNFALETIDRLRSNFQYSSSPAMDIGAGHAQTQIDAAGILKGEIAGLGGTLTYDVTEPWVSGYKQVTVKVHWDEPTF
ncbi:MAG: type II secretion system protein [Candidatus Omnitrophota bacterium]|nr:type II secretion system protein [Candidatus Omnitrophota bacterium]